MSTISQSTTRETPPAAPPTKRLNGPEKVAILLLCLGEERGSAVMQLLDEAELQRIGRAMSGLGPIPAELAEAVLAEFRRNRHGRGRASRHVRGRSQHAWLVHAGRQG
jgi:flagellar motor switch protein FliG